jgi:8-oxo-dGTP diphosphatase
VKTIEPRKVAKAALFNENNEILILNRSKADPISPGMVDFPGGALDPGESPDQAILREIQEEIGVALKPGDVSLMYAHSSFFNNKNVLRYVYVGKLAKNSIIKLSHEHDNFKWAHLDEVIQVYDHPVYVGALNYLLKNKQLEL